jgi:hypothetical protein
MHLSGLYISTPRRPKRDIIDKTCPNSTDIEGAREFLINRGATYDFRVSGYGKGIDDVVNWMQVNSCILMQEKLISKTRQKNPDSPRKLIKQYQVIANIIHYYSRSSRRRGPIPNFFKNVHKMPRFSIVDCWTNVKKFLKQGT